MWAGGDLGDVGHGNSPWGPGNQGPLHCSGQGAGHFHGARDGLRLGQDICLWVGLAWWDTWLGWAGPWGAGDQHPVVLLGLGLTAIKCGPWLWLGTVRLMGASVSWQHGWSLCGSDFFPEIARNLWTFLKGSIIIYPHYSFVSPSVKFLLEARRGKVIQKRKWKCFRISMVQYITIVKLLHFHEVLLWFIYPFLILVRESKSGSLLFFLWN